MLRLAIIVLVLAVSACAAQNRPLQLLAGQGPVYPAAARADGVEGSVTIRYDVTAEGAVANARVVASTPTGVFDEAALAAVRSWRFNAPTVAGEPQPARNRESTLDFRLGGGDAYDNY